LNRQVQLELQAAGPDDLEQVQKILSESARWMREQRGVTDQWPERFPDGVIADAIAAGEVFLARVGSDVIGTIRIQDADEAAWGEDEAQAIYVHSLAVRRDRRGQGLGAAILDQVQKDAGAAGKPLLRLDCLATNTGLRRYYNKLGFTCRGNVVQRIGKSRWTSSLFERSIEHVVEPSPR
jgi:GNAT superfamily N-acetyltransferase